MKELSTANREELHRELETTSDFAQRLSLKLNELPAGDVFEVASTIFSSIEAKTRKVLRQYECRRKPTRTDRRVSQLSAKTHPSILEIEELNTLITMVSEEKKTRAQKRVHASLVSGGGMRKAMAAYSSAMAPPIALTDANGAPVSDPASVCSLMSSTLLNLGGDIQQSVPMRTEQKFLSKVKRSSPKITFVGGIQIHYPRPQTHKGHRPRQPQSLPSLRPP